MNKTVLLLSLTIFNVPGALAMLLVPPSPQNSRPGSPLDIALTAFPLRPSPNMSNPPSRPISPLSILPENESKLVIVEYYPFKTPQVITMWAILNNQQKKNKNKEPNLSRTVTAH
jgi:hypothetical protein